MVAEKDVEIRYFPDIALFILEGTGHGVGNHFPVGPHVAGAGKDVHGGLPVGILVFVQPVSCADQSPQ